MSSDLEAAAADHHARIMGHDLSIADRRERFRKLGGKGDRNRQYAEGGLTEGPATTIRLDPDECIALAVDARAGRLVCGRPDHPTTTSDCKR